MTEEQLTNKQREVLQALLNAPTPGREVNHAIWSALSGKKLITGPGSDGLIRITKKGKDLLA